MIGNGSSPVRHSLLDNFDCGWLPRAIAIDIEPLRGTQLYFLGAGFGILSVHDPPNTNVRPWMRALAEYSS